MADDTLSILVRMRGAKQAAADAKTVAKSVDHVGGAQKRVASSGKAMETQTRRTGGSLRLLGRGAAYALGAGGFGGGLFALFTVGRQVTAQYRESQSVMRATNNTIRASGSAAGVTAKHVSDLSTKLSMQAGVDDELIQKGENMLLTFTSIRNAQGKGNKIFDRTTQLALDLSAAYTAAGKNMSVTDASLQLGKALNDPAKGMMKLTRIGIQFTDQEQKQIKSLTEHNDTLGAQRVMIDAINRQGIKGAAAAQATSWSKLTVVVGNLQEALGNLLAPAVDKAARAVTPFLQQMMSGTGQGGRFVATVKSLGQSVLAIVTPVAHAAGDLAKFGAAHPNLVKVGLALWGVKLAVGGIGSAATALNTKWGAVFGADGLIAKARAGVARFRSWFVGRSAATGAAAGRAESVAMAGSGGLTGPASFNRHRSAGRRLGGVFGRGFGIVALAALTMQLDTGLSNYLQGWIDKHVKDDKGRNILSGALQGIKNLGDPLGNALHPSGGVQGRKASGGIAQRRGRYLVGEHGPEVVNLSEGDNVTPHGGGVERRSGLPFQLIVDGKVLAESIARAGATAKARG